MSQTDIRKVEALGRKLQELEEKKKAIEIEISLIKRQLDHLTKIIAFH